MNINEVITRIQQLSKKTVKADSYFNELQIDSLSLAELVFEFEEKYEVQISDEDLIQIKQVKDIIEVFDKVIK
ncbi:UNVERIFIED_CONTAM: phosphopantetheine-binding protein [Campylobacter lari]